MGLDWAYDLYLPARNVEKALRLVAAIARRGDDLPGPVRVTLPGGAELSLPFTSNFRSDPVGDWSARGYLTLETVLYFPLDDAVIRRWAEDNRPAVDEAGNRIWIGTIYLSVWYQHVPRAGYATMSFTAATTGMSHLFAASSSVRHVFTELAAAAEAACCVLDREGDGDEICWLDGEPVALPLARTDLQRLAAGWPSGS